MNRTCKVPGCSKPTRSPQGTMCEAHRQRWRRHGDPKQEAIRKQDIAPLMKQVRDTIERDSSGQIEAGLKKLKSLLEAEASSTIAESRSGAMSSYRLKTAHEIQRVLQNTDALTCASGIAAIYLLQERNSRRFASDRGFTFQLVRRFRALTDLNAGTYYNNKTGKVHRVYKDLPAQVTEFLGRTLIERYKTFVAFIIKRDRKKAEETKSATDLIAKGFNTID